jgi:hypothetical protein
MTTFFRKFAFSLALACLALTFSGAPVLADESGDSEPYVKAEKTVHKKKVVHVKKATKGKHAKAAKVGNVVSEAQEHLAHLGYYTGKIDGKMGPQTKRAIKNFQREHGLKPDGVLGPKTLKALREADKVVLAPPPSTKLPFLTHEYVDDTNLDIHQDYAPPLKGGVKTVYSRFAGVNVTEASDGADKRYTVSMNGQPVLMAGNQSTVIGVSKTYDLGDEDAIILTTYNSDSPVCAYSNFALVLNATGNKLLEIENCTRGYEAEVNNGTLIISFPERDDKRMLGSTWRLEGLTLTRL